MESVVLLDEAGQASGTADKVAVHHDRTPLHLAFSCYLFNQAGQFLLTRRAESKRTFPGVWTNTCCGHPLPGEPMSDSVLRRLRDELGISSAKLTLLLPRFRYQARMHNGVLENEVCPVYAAYADELPDPDPAEVAEARWVDWDEFWRTVRGNGPMTSIRLLYRKTMWDAHAWVREAFEGIPAAAWVESPWRHTTSIYGPAATRLQEVAARLTGSSVRGRATLPRDPPSPGATGPARTVRPRS